MTIKENMAEYKDKSVHNVGVLGIVEIDGNQYAIECMYDSTDNSKINDCSSYLSKFNNLNNLNHISID